MNQFRRGPSLRQVVLSYAPDWIVTFATWWILYYISHHVTGFKRHFSLADPSLRYPYAAQQRVSTQALWLLGSVLPLGVQIVVNLLFIRSWWDLHHGALGLWLSITITGSITQIIKVVVGRPRPGGSIVLGWRPVLIPIDLISRCQPLTGSEDPLLGLSTIDICTQTSKHILEDGWRSFPSGHSSLSFAGLGFLTFYLAGKLRLFDTRGYASKVWLLLVPIGVASWVALSRTMDYRHHWEDVLSGSALGLGVAYFSYRQYYPHLASKTAHIPFTTRFEEVEYNIDNGTAIFTDGDADDNEEAGLIGGRRKPQGSGRT
ncbi:phosphatidic acid phosphatase type 2/haloperoxidase [Lanmaoa asiatica]|nr:phosphatidic acid phosphatase type 2/haloperoxidase [Lanmaoa asiatica]